MIEVVGAEGSSEYRAAIMVRDALEAAWPGVATSPVEEEDIKIAVSVKISGYRVQDIDVVLAGRLARPRQIRPARVIRGRSGNRLNGQPMLVESFVVALEVKDQDERAVRVNDDQVLVRYSRSGKIEWKSATDQNVKQLHALKSYFSDQNADVFARRGLVFPSLDSISAPSAVASRFNGHQLMSAIASSSPVLERRGQGYLSAGSSQSVEKVLASPLFRPMIPTRLDRERMERLAVRNPAVDEVLQTLGSGTVFLRGYGGTGKTVLLLQTAWKQYKVEGKRTLILTYNLALAADMRRLMALAGIPSSPEDGGIEISTVMSLLYRWFARFHLLEGEELDISLYSEHCAAALEMVESGAIAADSINKIVAEDPDNFDFDYVFVDEGQDWPAGETRLLKSLYSPNQLCIVDGIDQFTRGQRANWQRGIPRDERKTHSLTTCLRLKRNLSLFVGEVARSTGMGWEAEANPVAGGGRLIVLCKPYAAAQELHEQLVRELRDDGNAPIDMLFCVQPHGIERDGDVTRSAISTVLAKWGTETWDGVDRHARLDFPRSSNQARIVQYASCRGLEGWTVVLDRFDSFLEHIASWKGSSEAIATERFVDPETARDREAWRWGMIALTRPIDTLVIQLHDSQSKYAKQVLDIATAFEDCAEIIR